MDWSKWFYYDETSPSCLRWNRDVLTGSCNQVTICRKGDLAGSLDVEGYYRGMTNGRSYKAHRVVWELHFGAIPSGMVIDHIDGNPSNNIIKNLRLVTYSGNSRNMVMSSRNSSGVVGVGLVEQVNRQGNHYFYWTAYWTNREGKLKQKSFSFLKHGSEKAKELAIAYREKMIIELNLNGAGYTDLHGTKRKDIYD